MDQAERNRLYAEKAQRERQFATDKRLADERIKRDRDYLEGKARDERQRQQRIATAKRLSDERDRRDANYRKLKDEEAREKEARASRTASAAPGVKPRMSLGGSKPAAAPPKISPHVKPAAHFRGVH